MDIILGLLYVVLHLLVLVVLTRFVLEMVGSWARSWRPRGIVLVIASVVYAITDPIMRPLRRLIPPLRMGGIALDLSAAVMIFVLAIARGVVQAMFFS
ncbi:YggT family protein [Kocuria coralli]|uniref:YggT family protein n=1 Tax=Kocuria coralli TaxID=1461025 RepID=A0A5J5L048_9MICC|nr:YggT family protein [Kocuria coralli]KAA9394416.1 YggT family protein [Kocuria coralli]